MTGPQLLIQGQLPNRWIEAFLNLSVGEPFQARYLLRIEGVHSFNSLVKEGIPSRLISIQLLLKGSHKGLDNLTGTCV